MRTVNTRRVRLCCKIQTGFHSWLFRNPEITGLRLSQDFILLWDHEDCACVLYFVPCIRFLQRVFIVRIWTTRYFIHIKFFYGVYWNSWTFSNLKKKKPTKIPKTGNVFLEYRKWYFSNLLFSSIKKKPNSFIEYF